MAVIAVLNTLVQADTSSFEKGMGKAAQAAQGFQTSNAKVSQNVDRAWGSIQSMTGLGGIIGGIVGPWLGAGAQIGAIIGGLGGAAAGVFGRMQGQAGGVAQALGAMSGRVQAAGSESSGVLSGLGTVAGYALGGVVGAAAAAAAGVVGLGVVLHSMASRGAESIESLRLLSRQLGVTTETMASFGAAHGIDQETFARGVVHMQRSIADGSTEAAAALARMGLSLAELRTQSPDQQLRSVYGAFGSLTNQTERASTAMALFSRGGIGMLDSLNEGSAGLERMRARAERFGLTFTAEQANTVRRANSEWGNFGKAFEGISRQAAVAFAPLWEAAGKVGGAVGETLVSMFKAAMPDIQDVFGKVAGWITSLVPPIQEAGRWLVETFRQSMPAIRAVGDAVGQIAYYLLTANPLVGLFRAAWRDLGIGNLDLAGVFRAAIPWVKIAAETVATLFDTASQMAEGLWGIVWRGIKAVGAGLSIIFGGSQLAEWFGNWNTGWESVRDIAISVMAHITIFADRWKDAFGAAIDWVQLKFLQFVRSMSETISNNRILATILSGGLAVPLNSLILAPNLGNINAQITRLQNSFSRYSDSIGADVHNLTEFWRREIEDTGSAVMNHIEEIRQEEQPQGRTGPGGGARGELPLANSAAAMSLFWNREGNRDALARGQFDETRRQTQAVQQMLSELRRSPVIRQARR